MRISLNISMPCPRLPEQLEQLLGKAMLFGYQWVAYGAPSDIIIFFGCANRQDSIDKSKADLDRLKRTIQLGKPIIVFGCIGEYFKEELEKNGIKVFTNLEPLLNHLRNIKGLPANYYKDAYIADEQSSICNITIGNGCPNNCTFCKCHYLDRPLKSIPREEVLKRMYEKRKIGQTILSLAALNSTTWGQDLYGDNVCWLADIITAAIGMKFHAIDLKALNIADIDEKLENVLVNSPIPIILDLPLQHSNNLVLQKMGRKITAEEMFAKVSRLRKNHNLIIQSGFMIGFPYEPIESIKQTIDWHRSMGIYHIDTFKYTDHQKVPSYKYPKFSQEEIERRFLMASILNMDLREEGIERLTNETIPIIVDHKENIKRAMPFNAMVEFTKDSGNIPNGLIMAKVLRPNGKDYYGYDGLLCKKV